MEKQLHEVEEKVDAARTVLSELPELQKEHEELDYQRLETVLLVEDDLDLNYALARRLQRAGLNVACAFDGPSALAKHKLFEPNVMVLDLCLPGMDGSKVLHSIRETPGMIEAPVIAITGKADPSLERKVTRWGVWRLLRKPVSPKQLLQTVLDALEGV